MLLLRSEEDAVELVRGSAAVQVDAVRGVGARQFDRRHAAAAPLSLPKGYFSKSLSQKNLRQVQLRPFGQFDVKPRNARLRMEHHQLRRSPGRELHPQVVGIRRRIGLRYRRLDPEKLRTRLAQLADNLQNPLHHLSYWLISQS